MKGWIEKHLHRNLRSGHRSKEKMRSQRETDYEESTVPNVAKCRNKIKVQSRSLD